MRRGIVGMILAMAMMCLLCAVAIAEPEKYVVAADTARLYKENSALCEAYLDIAQGETVLLHDIDGEWLKVTVNGRRGYMHAAGLQRAPEEAANPVWNDVYDGRTFYATSGSILYRNDAEGGDQRPVPGGAPVALYATNDAGWARVKLDGVKGYMKIADLREQMPATTPVPTPKPKPQAIEVDWWTSMIQTAFPVGATAKITDVETGISWYEVRKAGTSHADVQPVSSEDTEKMKQATGGAWTWDRRAIWVTIGGRKYAASMNVMPHGGSSVAGNHFPGHHCIHFTNSKTHGGDSVDPDHQAAIKLAASHA